jgi:hypothetical protein
MGPRPSDDPVMNTRATPHLRSSRRPFRLTIPNGLPVPRVLPALGTTPARESAIQEEEGRPKEQLLQSRRAREEIARQLTNFGGADLQHDEVDFRPSIRADRGSYLPDGTNRCTRREKADGEGDPVRVWYRC